MTKRKLNLHSFTESVKPKYRPSSALQALIFVSYRPSGSELAISMAAATAPAPGAAPTNGTPAATAGNAEPNAPQPGGAKPVGAVAIPIPPNKPGEPPFQLKLEPDARLEFVSDKLTEGPCHIVVKLTNPTKDRQTFKVRCTSNEIFRVHPPLGFCDPEASTPIKIIFSSKTIPDSGRHYFAFYHMKNDEKDKTARQVWTPQSKFDGVRRIMVYFLKGDKTPAPPTAPAEGVTPTGGNPAGPTPTTPTSPAATSGSVPTANAPQAATPTAAK